MTRILCIAFLALALVLLAAPAVQAQYVIEQTINAGYNPWIKGQTFTSSIGINPDPGSVSTLDLKTITLYRSAQPWSGPTSNFYLNIYDGDPVNSTGAFVGSSINSIDVAPLGDFAPMTWRFEALNLDYTHEYWALVSSTNTDGGLDVYCGMRESGQTDPYTGGTSIAGISSDPGGFHVKPTVDLAFEIVLESWLAVDTYTVPQAGGTANFSLDAGVGNGNRNYLLVGGVTGTMPGMLLPGGLATLPINWDAFSDLEMALLNSIVFSNFMGKLDGGGTASAQLNVPSLPSSAVGLMMYFAYCCNNPFDFASNAVVIEVVL